jgi:hypothetical protein
MGDIVKLRHVIAAALACVVFAGMLFVPSAGAATRGPSASLPTLTELRAARIKLSDLPGSYRRDYSRDTDTPSTSSSSDPRCSAMLEALNGDDGDSTAPRKAEVKFSLDRTVGPFVENSLAAFRSKAPAVAGMTQIRSLLRACDRWTETDTDGTKATVRLTRLAMPALGSDRLAFRARISVQQGAYTITARLDLAVVRVRAVVTMVSVLSFGSPEGADLIDLTRRSTRRLQAVL